MKKVILVWFRNDLRIHDNEILSEAVKKADIVIPVYFFDPRYFKKNKLGFRNTGVLRARFLLESVAQFKETLQNMDTDLLVFQGKPEDIIGTLCAKYDVTEVYHHREVANRETKISEYVEETLWQEKINLKHFIGHTLYHKEDLPFPIRDIPDMFAAFKKKIEKESFVRPVVAPVTSFVTHPHLESTTIPSLLELGYSEEEIKFAYSRPVEHLRGGETAARQTAAKTLSPEFDDMNDYNLVSPYIAVGAISPADYYHQIKERYTSANKKKYERLILRLFWRDYFRFMLKKYPNVFFRNQDLTKDVQADAQRLRQHLCEDSHHPVINDLLNILQSSGNLPYEHREILAAYFKQELSIHYLAGAGFFEEYLLDYVPATTYGYWLHFAEKGTSPKDNLKTSWQDLVKKYYRPKAVIK
ncbi:deoxyribodipyrimidine photo-lyase [Sphingobacterium suaedae]